jgi:hypothetical protein
VCRKEQTLEAVNVVVGVRLQSNTKVGGKFAVQTSKLKELEGAPK